MVVWSESFRNKGSAAFSYSLKAVGIGILYLSLWAASQYFHLVPSSVAFVAMILVTASTITLALTQDAEILAVYAMIGGFSTPALVSTGENHEIILFSYVLLLDVAILAMVAFKPWRRIVWGAMLGTAVMYIGWWAQYYDSSERTITVLFASAFFAVFALVPLLTPLTRSRWHRGMSITLMLLPLLNGAAYFLALFIMYDREVITLTWYALALAAVYLVLSSQFKRRVGSDPDVVKTVNLLHVAVAIAFITTAIPLKLDAHWITIGWLIESAVLLFVAVKSEAHFLRVFAGCTLALGVCRLLFFDNFHTETLVLNARFATFLVAIAILAGIVAAGERYGSEREMPFVKLAGIALNLLALIALTREANDYFNRHIAEVYQHRNMYGAAQQLEIARDFSFSAIWIVYGAALMVIGLLEALSVHTLAGHGADGGHHWQGLPLRLARAAADLPHPELYCAGRDADGNLVRLSSRLVQVIAAQECAERTADIIMNPGMKWGAVLLAGVVLAGPSIPFSSIKDLCKRSRAANAFWQWTSRYGKMRGLIWAICACTTASRKSLMRSWWNAAAAKALPEM